MSRSQRYIHDSLQISREPRWLTIRGTTGALLEYRRLEPGTDLVRAFLAAMLDQHDTGWLVADFSATGSSARLECGAQRRMMGIEEHDPEKPRDFAPGYFTRCQSCED
jgi:hypothetical protein